MITPGCGTTACCAVGELLDTETGWEWLSALGRHNAKPLQGHTAAASHAFNPLFHGDLLQGPLSPQLSRQRSQALNPVFRAKHAERAELDVDSSSWQLQGLASDARTALDEVPNLAWNRSTSSGSNLFIAASAQQQLPDSPERVGISSRHSSSGSSDDAHSADQLLSHDHLGSGDWVLSSSSSEDSLAPLRSISLPESAVARLLETALDVPASPSRGVSLPAGFRAGLPAVLERQATPVLTLRQRYGSRHSLTEPEEDDAAARSSLSLSSESNSADSEMQAVSEDIQLQMPGNEGDEMAVPQQVQPNEPATQACSDLAA